MVICDTFQKREENVPRSYVTLFRNGRKMSYSHMLHFSEKGGKYSIVIYDTFQKQEEKVPWSYVILFRNGRKMSHGHM